MNLKLANYLFLILIITGCNSTFLDVLSEEELEEALKTIEIESDTHINNVVYIQEGNIYLMKDIDKKSPIKILNSSGNNRKNLKISFDNKKILFFEENVGVVIIDENGKTVEIVEEIERFDQMDWLPDNQGFYYLVNDELHVHGSNIELPKLTWDIFSQQNRIISASVSKNGDVAYVLKYFDFNGGNKSRLYYKSSQQGKSTFGFDGNLEDGKDISYVNFSSDGEALVVGYKQLDYDKNLKRIEIYTDLTLEKSIRTYENEKGIVSPCYSKEINYFVTGYTLSSDGEPSMAFFDLDKENTFWYEEIVLTELDWKSNF